MKDYTSKEMDLMNWRYFKTVEASKKNRQRIQLREREEKRRKEEYGQKVQENLDWIQSNKEFEQKEALSKLSKQEEYKQELLKQVLPQFPQRLR